MRVSFVMLGFRDHRTGGYDFNGKVADALEAAGHRVDRIHYSTVPASVRGRRGAGSLEVLRRVALGRPDVVAVSRSYAFMVPLRLLLAVWRVPVVYLVHHLEWKDTPGIPRRAYRAMVRWMVGRGDRVWCNSRATRDGVAGLGIPAERIRVIPPGFSRFPEAAENPETSGPPAILCVGAVTRRKGQLDIVRACSNLKDLEFRLILAGSLREEPGYAAEVADAAAVLGNAVEITGYLDKERVYRLMAGADILVHGAPWEAYGIALAEAMWAGLPVVASRAGAVPEMVTHGVEGLLYDPGDIEGLSEHLARLIVDDDLRTVMGAAARRRAEGLNTWETTCEEFVNLVEETAGRQVRRDLSRRP
jgi:glycosyltransferase involved in cell wall biosynthesis